jgi:hypothetical protein
LTRKKDNLRIETKLYINGITNVADGKSEGAGRVWIEYFVHVINMFWYIISKFI